MPTCRFRFVILVLTGLAAACGGSTSPTPFTLPTTGTGSFSGTAVAWEGGAPVGGASVQLSGLVTTTDAQGRFAFSNAPDGGTGALTINASGLVQRGLAVRLAPLRSGLVVDVIRDAAPFSLDFYREFVRNRLSSGLQPTRPWTMDPSFYLKTTVEGSSFVLPQAIIDGIRASFEKSVPELSGGRFRMAAFEVGAEARPEQTGWVNVTFAALLSGGALGTASVGGNQGTMLLRYDPALASNSTTNPFGCAAPTIAIADHEITHTMGFWHTSDTVNDTFSGPGCPGAPRPARTRYHAAVMYSRPVGNRDPDIDPVDLIQATADEQGARPIATCFDFAHGAAIR